MLVRRLLSVALFVYATPLFAQVGYPPAASPYRDLNTRHQLDFFGGYFKAGADVAGAAPQSGPLVGLRYDMVIAGPAQFMVRAMRVASERATFDPTLPAARRATGRVSDPVYLAEVGFSFNITGQKSYRGVVPVITGAVGIASDLGKRFGKDPYQFGTSFALSSEAALRYRLGGAYELRGGIGSTFYQISYPDAYFINASDGTALVTNRGSKSSYRNNISYTLGISRALFR